MDRDCHPAVVATRLKSLFGAQESVSTTTRRTWFPQYYSPGTRAAFAETWLASAKRGNTPQAPRICIRASQRQRLVPRAKPRRTRLPRYIRPALPLASVARTFNERLIRHVQRRCDEQSMAMTSRCSVQDVQHGKARTSQTFQESKPGVNSIVFEAFDVVVTGRKFPRSIIAR